MGLNVSGQEVATGIADPTVMFTVLGIILLIAVVAGVIFYLVSMFR